MFLVHGFRHGVSNVQVGVDVERLDDQFPHRLADDTDSDGQIPTSEMDIVRRRVRQRRGVVHVERHYDISRRSPEPGLVHQLTLHHRNVGSSHRSDELWSTSRVVDLSPGKRSSPYQCATAYLPNTIVTAHVRLVSLRRVRVRISSGSAARPLVVERTFVRDGEGRHPLHTKRCMLRWLRSCVREKAARVGQQWVNGKREPRPAPDDTPAIHDGRQHGK